MSEQGIGTAPRGDRQLVKPLVGEREPTTYGHCPYCGRPCRGRACSAHHDLVLLEHISLLTETSGPDRTPSTDARTDPPTEGV